KLRPISTARAPTTAQPPPRNQSPARRPLHKNRSRSIKIHVRLLNNTAHDLEVDGSDTNGSVKTKIMEKEGVPPQQQLLFFADEGLEDARTLADHGIEDGASVCLIAINMMQG
uniref:Ubiquitin-like domain-containing protein n=2 Tax=Aegilops tauschii subsp. strangulata TaxID=200361 RepID=A0A453QPF0_AEGTS